MTPDRYQKVLEIFLAACGRDGADRASYLDHTCAGDPELRDEVEVLLVVLRIAEHYLRNERVGHALQATALVKEAYLKLVDQKRIDWKRRNLSQAMFAIAIRRILVDHGRRHRHKTTLSDTVATEIAEKEVDVESLDVALQRLAELNERQAQVAELRFFGGLSVEDVAKIIGVSERTAKGDWRVAKAWLKEYLSK